MDPGEIVVHEVQGYRMGMVGEASRARAQGARSRPLNPPGFSGFFPGRIAVLDRLSFFSHPFLHVVFSFVFTHGFSLLSSGPGRQIDGKLDIVVQVSTAGHVAGNDNPAGTAAPGLILPGYPRR